MARKQSQRERLLEMLQQRHPEYHPVLAMAKIAHDTADERLAFDAHKAVAKFVEPELRSVEVKGEINGGGITVMTINGEGSRDLIADMQARRRELMESIDAKATEISTDEEKVKALPLKEKENAA